MEGLQEGPRRLRPHAFTHSGAQLLQLCLEFVGQLKAVRLSLPRLGDLLHKRLHAGIRPVQLCTCLVQLRNHGLGRLADPSQQARHLGLHGYPRGREVPRVRVQAVQEAAVAP